MIRKLICGFEVKARGAKATERMGACLFVEEAGPPVVWTVYFFFRYSRWTALKAFPG